MGPPLSRAAMPHRRPGRLLHGDAAQAVRVQVPVAEPRRSAVRDVPFDVKAVFTAGSGPPAKLTSTTEPVTAITLPLTGGVAP